MRLLIVTHHFPPHTTVGALRVGKTAKYLRATGHSVRVVTAIDDSRGASTPVEIPAPDIQYTRWVDVNRLVSRAAGGQAAASELLHGGPRAGWRRALRGLGGLYRALINIPDSAVGWLPFALHAAAKQIEAQRPDVLFASAPPYTSLVAAAITAKRFGLPWVADLRDPWVGYHEYSQPPWRARLDANIERRVLGSAAALVTVSDPIAVDLRRRFSAPVHVVTNGFDPEDYAGPRPASGDERLRLVYTGHIHGRKQDPTPLARALDLLGEHRERVRVVFYGRRLETTRAVFDSPTLRDVVEIHDPIPHAACVREQRAADLLLFLVWNDVSERGVVTGKLFEYAGARRPILAIGPRQNVAAQEIVDRGLGVVASEPREIAEYLATWIDAKRRGSIPGLPSDAIAGMTRQEQAAVLERILLDVVSLRG